MVAPSGSISTVLKRSTPGTRPESGPAARRSKTRPAIAKAVSASSISPICAIRTVTSFAGCTGRRSDAGDRFREQVAGRATARREAWIGGDFDRDDLLDLPSSPERARKEAAGHLVSFRPHLHACERHRE